MLRSESHLFALANTTPDPRKAGARRDRQSPRHRQAEKADEEYAPPCARGARLPDRARTRPRRHGHGVPRPATLARPAGRAQGDEQAVGERPGVRRPVHPRGYAAAQLSHPNIVQIHDIGEVDGTRFFSMEYVRGQSLADVVKAQRQARPGDGRRLRPAGRPRARSTPTTAA